MIIEKEVPHNAIISGESATMALGFKTEAVEGRQLRILHQRYLVVWRLPSELPTANPHVSEQWRPIPSID
jgi:hypothetical protein